MKYVYPGLPHANQPPPPASRPFPAHEPETANSQSSPAHAPETEIAIFPLFPGTCTRKGNGQLPAFPGMCTVNGNGFYQVPVHLMFTGTRTGGTACTLWWHNTSLRWVPDSWVVAVLASGSSTTAKFLSRWKFM